MTDIALQARSSASDWTRDARRRVVARGCVDELDDEILGAGLPLQHCGGPALGLGGEVELHVVDGGGAVRMLA